jgi:adenine-specific DNA-methyltransferase
MNKIDKETLNIKQEHIEKLKELFPSIVTDGKIDFDQLKTILGQDIDESNERYQFTWNGKRDAIKLAQSASTGTLRPSVEDSVNWDSTENMYIEGDNLEVLKQLQKTYFGKIKMIYIDPPYNTGTNILYKNDFSAKPSEFKSAQNLDKVDGGTFFKNTLSSASFHTDWINIMFSRLLLSRNLLTEDGVIVIAIDHNELANLTKISDEIFGETNRLGIVTVVHKPEGRNQEKFFATSTEYSLFYAKNISKCEFSPSILDDSVKETYNLEDEIGKYRLNNYIRLGGGDQNSRENKSHFYYPMYVSKDLKKISLNYFNESTSVFPDTKTQERTWKTKKTTTETEIEKGNLVALKDNDNINIYEKYRISNGQLIKTHWVDKKYNAIYQGTRLVENLFGMKIFDFPKSVMLIMDILKFTSQKDSIILDFFSGSATTAHAVMKLNAEDNGNRKFIMVQLPEKTDESSEAYKAGYENICEIGKERIRRAGKQIKEELEKEGKETSSLDTGFKVFKLDDTNIKAWDAYADVSNETLFSQESILKDGRTKQDLLYEILLKYGVFDKKVNTIKVNQKTMYRVGENSVIIDLNDTITLDDVRAIATLKPMTVIFYEDGFEDDNVKINAEVILKDHGVEDVRSI